jgi:hypothetical protein
MRTVAGLLAALALAGAAQAQEAYARIEETLAPAALDRIVQWVATHARAGAGSLR